MIAMTRIALFSAMIVHFTSATAIAQTVETRAREDSYLLAYFLDEEPSDVGLAALPANAQDVVVARVSLTRGPIYLVMRENSGVPSGSPPKYLFRSWLRVVQVVRGRALVGEQLDVTFRKPNYSGRMTMVPRTRDEVSREYFVIAYVDEDGQGHLAGYPISEAKYKAWETGTMERITKFPR